MWIRLPASLSIGVLLAHSLWEGMHWQMASIYLALILLAYPALVQTFPARKTYYSVLYGGFLALLMIGGLAICYALPMFQLNKPTGPYPVGTRTLYFLSLIHI